MGLADQGIRRITHVILNEHRQRVDVFGWWVVVELADVVQAGLCFEEIDLHDREFGRIRKESLYPVEQKIFENDPFACIAGLLIDLVNVVVVIVFIARAALEDTVRSEIHLHQPAVLIVQVEGRIARGYAVHPAQAHDGFAEAAINKGKAFLFDIVQQARALAKLAARIPHHVFLVHNVVAPVL